MTGRRMLFCVLFAVTMAGSLALAALALSPGGIGVIDIVLLVLFAMTLPWMVAGFWNAMIGFLIMRFSDDPIAAVVPITGQLRGDEPITASTAILLCIRNELPDRMIRNLEPMLAGLAVSGSGDRFHLYVLSDTGDFDIAARKRRASISWPIAGAAASRSPIAGAISTPATRPETSATSASDGARNTNSP